MIKIQENVSFKDCTTFRIGGKAKYFTVVKNEADLKEAFSFAKGRKLLIFILGGGSNLLVSEHGFLGLVIKNEIKGIKFIDQADDKAILEIGAGEILDEVIALSVMRNLSGLENLSGVPGTVGGAAVQNAGAYGVEIKDCLISVEGLNSVNGKKFVLDEYDCRYGYRDSRFKKNKKLVITSIKLALNKKPVFNTDYSNLKEKLKKSGEITSSKIRNAVLEIRGEKLPDWRKIGTAGSFFKNPVITEGKFEELKEIFPELPGFPDSIGLVKISLAWVLDNLCGLRGYKIGKVGLYEKQPLVVVNFGGATEKEVSIFIKKIIEIVKQKINLELEPEVEKII